MYKLSRRSNLIPFLCILAVGIAASIFVPQFFPGTVGEIPAFALFPGEIAVALILSVLLFEIASPAELIRIAGVMLIIAFLDGALCNVIGSNTIWLPEATFRLNWVQLIAFNLTGMGAIMSLYTTEPDSAAPYGGAVRDLPPATPKEAAPSKIDFTPAEGQQVSTGAEAQEIISGLDVGRINQLEQSISPEKVSLESLFAEEGQAPAKKVDAKPVFEAPRPEPVIETPAPAPTPVIEVVPPAPEPKVEPPVSAGAEGDAAAGRLFGDVSNDIENIFNDLVGPETATATPSQKDFSPAETTPAAPTEDQPPVAPPPGPATPVAEEAPAAEESFGPQLTDAGTSAKTAVKEFGKLSAAAHKPDATTGTLKTIGQMLLDTAAVEKILKKAEKNEGGSKWRVLTVDRGADLQKLMDKLGAFEGVESALLMGKDGLLLSNTETISSMKYVYGPLSLAMLSTTGLGTAKLQMGELRQCVLKSGDKVSILTDVGSAIVCVFAEWNVASIDKLMEYIGTSIAGSDALGDDLPEEVPSFPEETPAPAPAPEPIAKAKEPEGGIVNVSDSEVSDLFDNLLADESPAKKETPAPAAAPAAAAPAAPTGGVLNVSDGEVSDLFDNLLADDSPAKKKEAEAAAAAAAPAPTPAAPASGGVLNVSDGEVSDLFDNLLAEPAAANKMDFAPAEGKAAEEKKEQPPEAPAAAPEAAPVAESKPPEQKSDKKDKKKGDAPQHKEFGKLSTQAAKADTGQEQGAMKAIGRQLIDVQAVENIIKAGEKREKIGSGLTTARVISAARGEGIKTLLQKIDTHDGVIGSLIVGHDGLVIASTLQSNIDKDMMGALCTAIYSHTDVSTKKTDHGKLQQIVFVNSDQKLTVMTSVAVGILAVFADNCGVPQVDGLLNAIETTVRG